MSSDKVPPSPVSLPLFYANSFVVSVSNADATITLQVSGQPLANVMISYNALKSLSLNLQKAVAAIENASGQTILSSDDLQPAVAKLIAGGEKK